MTVGFHFIFPPISIGLSWLLVLIEAFAWKRKDEVYEKIGKFFSKILALSFAVGVATGITMEFQFGTNWAEYSKFVGDIFRRSFSSRRCICILPGIWFSRALFIWKKEGFKGTHWFSILMVAIGATISAFWIIVAGSWMQTPAGYIVRNGRAELTNFWVARFNPSTMVRFFHTS